MVASFDPGRDEGSGCAFPGCLNRCGLYVLMCSRHLGMLPPDYQQAMLVDDFDSAVDATVMAIRYIRRLYDASKVDDAPRR